MSEPATKRSVPEWIGKTPDSKPPPHVRMRVFAAYDGRCYLSKRKIMPGDLWDLDHIKSLGNEGENRESNLAPALKDKHREKTARDIGEQRKIESIKAKHFGLKKRSTLTHPRLKRRMDGSVVERDA